MSETLEKYDNFVELYANKGYAANVGMLAQCKDTGNGYIVYFPSYMCTEQANYICMDYAEAEYIRKLLNYLHTKGD